VRVTHVAAILLVSSSAAAEPSGEDRALATALFNEARALLADGNVAPACRKLEESKRLDPLPGTLLNLAACHEKEGLLASAFAEFREARVLAERDHRDDRVTFADEHMRAIEPRISKLVIALASDTPDVRVTRDGTPLGRAAWGTRIPVDPGEHVIEASAPGKKAAHLVVTVGPDGDVQTVEIPPLADEAPAPPAPALEASREAPPAAPPALSGRRTAALAVAGVGLVGLGLGTAFGVRAIQKHDDPGAVCTSSPCSSGSVSLNDQAKFAADVSTVSFAVALVALGTSAFLWFFDPTAKTARLVF
jgi:hypothetical protein